MPEVLLCLLIPISRAAVTQEFEQSLVSNEDDNNDEKGAERVGYLSLLQALCDRTATEAVLLPLCSQILGTTRMEQLLNNACNTQIEQLTEGPDGLCLRVAGIVAVKGHPDQLQMLQQLKEISQAVPSCQQ